VGKAFGMGRAMKGGIGSATADLEGGSSRVKVAALAAVNALGDVVSANPGRIIAGARKSPDDFASAASAAFTASADSAEGTDSAAFADTAAAMLRGAVDLSASRENTTLVVVATNAHLSKLQCRKLAQLAQIGLARSIRPAHTMYDGDVVIALSLGAEQADIHALGLAAAAAVEQSIWRGVRLAEGKGFVAGLADRGRRPTA
jgi:L-aminopeptidase/D-esterase-like protein